MGEERDDKFHFSFTGGQDDSDGDGTNNLPKVIRLSVSKMLSTLGIWSSRTCIRIGRE